MHRTKSKLIPHELRPANTAQSTIEQNRLSTELKKLEKDKNISISQLSASQAVLQKSLRAMVTGGQQSAQEPGDSSQPGPSPAPSVLNPNFGPSHLRVAESTPRSGSRVNVITADPDVLATYSTKSFSGQIIGGQAQLVRKLESNRNVRMSQSSLGSSATHMSRSSMGMIMDGSVYNVPEKGATTGVNFTEEDVEHGVRDHHHTEETSPPAPSEASHQSQGGVTASLASDVLLPGALETSLTSAVSTAGPGAPPDAAAQSRHEDVQLAVPEMPSAPRSELASPEPALKVIESPSGRSMGTSRPESASTKDAGLSRLSPTSVVAPSTAPSPPVLPASISQQVYTRAVERAFANKCLKHSKFVTDLEMNEFVTKYLLIEQQNENFKRANEFVYQIVDTQMELQ